MRRDSRETTRFETRETMRFERDDEIRERRRESTLERRRDSSEKTEKSRMKQKVLRLSCDEGERAFDLRSNHTLPR